MKSKTLSLFTLVCATSTFAAGLFACSGPPAPTLQVKTPELYARGVADAETLAFFADPERRLGERSLREPNHPDWFSNRPGSYDSNYILGADDELDVTINSEPSVKTTQKVGRDGKIILDFIGEVEVGGRSIVDAKRAILGKLAGFLASGEGPRVEVGIRMVKERERFVEIIATGLAPRVRIRFQGDLLDALSEAGWTPGMGIEEVRIFRMRGATSDEKTVVLSDILERGRIEENIIVDEGDKIFIADRRPIVINGAVETSGFTYKVHPRQNGVSIAQLLTSAGGVAGNADLARVQIVSPAGEITKIDLRNALFQESARETIVLLPGDTVHVPRRNESIRQVFVLGMVRRPGVYEIGPDSSVLHLLSLAEFERFGAVTSEAVLVTGWPENPESHKLDLDGALEGGRLEYNLPLHDGDVLYIPESTLSDVLDTIGRILSPVSGGAFAVSNIDSARGAIINED
ncbi:MAG: polysaccharide biosynthesis/export family protein [Planctomycetes bacterium]|nr:polysaccharide biosynthesis/export family protein [Planctomycetota bacterium]